jgi:DNA-binding MarR family transcriptional regulator
MSRDPSPERLALMRALADAVRANQRGTDAVDDLASQIMGVNRTDARILDILDQHGQMSAGQLAAASGLTSGAITAAIDRLERAGYAHRVADPGDRRRVLVDVTPHTRELTWEMFGPMVERWREVSMRFSDDDLRLLIDFQRLGVEMQAHHADLLRERLAAQHEHRKPA